MRFVNTYLALAILLFLFIGCQKELSYDSTSSSLTGNFSANIDSAHWATTGTAYRGLGIITIAGQTTDGRSINITLVDSGVHNYTLTPTANLVVYKDAAGNEYFSALPNVGAAAGFVRVSSLDTMNKKITGTFTAKVYDDSLQHTVNITNGAFNNIAYTTTIDSLPNNPPGTGTDTLNFVRNGASWNATQIVDSSLGPLGKITIAGWNNSSNAIVQFVLSSNITPGTYDLPDFNATFSYYPNGLGGLPYLPETGSLTILEHNTTTRRIRGTFSSTFVNDTEPPTDTVKITNGYFSCRYD